MSSIYYGQLTVSLFRPVPRPGIGVTVDGLPAGEAIDWGGTQAFLNRRAPGRGPGPPPGRRRTGRRSSPALAGVHLRGAPGGPHSQHQPGRGTMTTSETSPRPGHADFTAQVKYGGFQDVAGGGHFSGRLTAPCASPGASASRSWPGRGSMWGPIAAVGVSPDQSYDPV